MFLQRFLQLTSQHSRRMQQQQQTYKRRQQHYGSS
jgi:hypothetical protein